MCICARFGIEWVRDKWSDSPLVIQTAVRYLQMSEEAPNIAVVPVDDWMNAVKAWPVGIGRVYECEFACVIMRWSAYACI